MNGLLLIISGPSGCGKSTLIGKAAKELPNLRFSISCTTRAPRQGEVDGRDYYFLTEEEFERKRLAGEFLEYAQVHTARYGTPKAPAMEAIANGEIMILDIDVQGARKVRAALAGTAMANDVKYLFLAPPSLEELERRLRGRNTETEAAIQTRLKNAAEELRCQDEYQYRIVNEDADQAARELIAVIKG